VIKKEPEKILKYKNLITEIHCMWKLKAKVIPVIRGVTGTISKSLKQLHKQHTRNKKKKKKVNIGHWTHTMASANAKVRNILHRQKNITCSINYYYRTAATIYSAETWFVNTLYKGDNKDDDDDDNYYDLYNL
jgi:hypothetical protein